MKINKRQAKIVEIVDIEKKISVKDLSTRLEVSEVTIRKDLDVLNDYGVLIRHHGYALKKNTADIVNRLSINYEIKRKVAVKAASLIDMNESVLIGSGSTCALLAEEIAKTKPGVTIITHSIYIAEHASKLGNNHIILLGGELQKDAQVLVGPLVRSSARQFFVDKIFIGTDGFVKNAGFMGSDSLRTDAIRNMAESARKIIIITDSSKFDKRGLLVQFPVNQVSELVTDSNLSKEYIDYFDLYKLKLDLVDINH